MKKRVIIFGSLNMKSKLQIGLIALGILLSTMCHARDVQVRTVSQVKPWCVSYIELESTSHVNPTQGMDAGLCEGYIMGIMEHLSVTPEAHPDGTFQIGTWEATVTIDQVTRVFVKFVNDQPQWLDKPAYLTIEKACTDNGLLTYKPWTMPLNWITIPADGKHAIGEPTSPKNRP
jgi:hypothetical protein